MSIKQIVEEIIAFKSANDVRVTKKDIAEHLGISRQNLANKFARDTFTPEELSKIAEKLGYTLILRSDDDEYIIKY